MASSEPRGSIADSSTGLSSIQINRNKPHPEQWTIPLEWSMERRECYDSWKLDLQSQISNIDKKLFESLMQYPQKDLGGAYRCLTTEEEVAQKAYMFQKMRGKMQQGLIKE